jgi:serine/threonine-protein kinase
MITTGDRLKIVDFMIGPQAEKLAAEETDVQHYRAPEQMGTEAYDHRVDLFALGAIAYEMIAGRTIAAAQPLERLSDVSAFRQPGFPEILKRFVVKACAADPAQRFDSAQDALIHLQALADHYGIPQGQPEGEQRKIATISLAFRERDQNALNQALEDFSSRIIELDAEITGMDIDDL